MPRLARASKLETRSARLRLPISKKPTFVPIGPGVAVGYRRNHTAGTWVVRKADGKGGNWTKAIAIADDLEAADGGRILDFWQAQDRARTLARGSGNDAGDEGKLVTVAAALDAYEADLKTRGGDVGNVSRVRIYLSEALASKVVALLTAGDLLSWRRGLIKEKLAISSINRSGSIFKAALNLAADHDERISNHRSWETGLKSIAGGDDEVESRNIILPEQTVRAIVVSAYDLDEKFGMLVEVAAVTGARVSQIARLRVQDLQSDRADPRLMMPTSRKGRGKKKISQRPVPIPASLAQRLLGATGDRPCDVLLLTKSSGDAWKKSDHSRLFRRAAACVGLDPTEVTLYALRHCSIVHALLANVPIRVVAVLHDTSVQMIERTYSEHIDDVSDSLSRPALFDAARPIADNVVPLSRAPRA